MKSGHVSERALLRRINRELAHWGWYGHTVKKSRPDARGCESVGDYYQVDNQHNFIADTQIDLEDLGRELGVLADGEDVVWQEDAQEITRILTV